MIYSITTVELYKEFEVRTKLVKDYSYLEYLRTKAIAKVSREFPNIPLEVARTHDGAGRIGTTTISSDGVPFVIIEIEEHGHG